MHFISAEETIKFNCFSNHYLQYLIFPIDLPTLQHYNADSWRVTVTTTMKDLQCFAQLYFEFHSIDYKFHLRFFCDSLFINIRFVMLV